VSRNIASAKAFIGSSVCWTPASRSNSEARPCPVTNRFHASSHSCRVAPKNFTLIHFSSRSELPSFLAKFRSVVRIICSNDCHPDKIFLGDSLLRAVMNLDQKNLSAVCRVARCAPARAYPAPGCSPLTKEKEGSFFHELRPSRARTLKLRQGSE
jgi:hypothetical protein